MNTVVVGKLVKTVKAQREVFRCRTSPDDFLKRLIVDLTIFTEIVEKREADGFRLVRKQFEQVVCAKFEGESLDDAGTFLGCGAFPVPLLP